MRCCCKILLACSRVVPTGAVTRFAGHEIPHRPGQILRFGETDIRLVKIPTSWLAGSTIGTPLMWKRAIKSSASRRVASGLK